MALTEGQILHERYRIERLLGEGGFGAVYQALDTVMDAACAVKENRDTSPAAQRQFEREARLLYKLKHPNLPRVFDHFTLPGQGQYLVMDYIEGEDLVSLLERSGGALPLEQTLAWIGQVCQALIYLHAQTPPVIHRDVKPGNIRLDAKDQAILVDFGIAKVFDPNSQTTTAARAVTPGYSPPEQYGLGVTDPQSDVYALGATVYHLLTGHVPPMAVDVMAGTASPPQPAHLVNPQVPVEVSLAIEKAIQINRGSRTQSVEQFWKELTIPEPLEDGKRLAAPFLDASLEGSAPASALQRFPVQTQALATTALGRPRRWTLPGWVVGGAVVLSLVAALTYFGLRPLLTKAFDIPGQQPLISPTLRGSAPIATILPTTVEQTPPAEPSPPTRTTVPAPLVLAGPPPAIPFDPMTAATLDQVEMLRLWSVNASAMAFSPDSSLLALALPDHTVQVAQLSTGYQVYRFEGHSGPVLALAFSPDGQILASGGKDPWVWTWDVKNGKPYGGKGEYISAVTRLAISQDGQVLAVIDEQGSLDFRWLIESDQTFPDISLQGPAASLDFSPNGKLFAIGTGTWEVIVRQYPEFRKVYTLEGHGCSVDQVAFSPDSTLLATGSCDKSVRLWNVADGQLLKTLSWNDQPITQLAFAPDGTFLVSGDSEGHLVFWSIPAGERLKEWGFDSLSELKTLEFSPDGKFLIVATSAGNVWFNGIAP